MPDAIVLNTSKRRDSLDRNEGPPGHKRVPSMHETLALLIRATANDSRQAQWGIDNSP